MAHRAHGHLGIRGEALRRLARVAVGLLDHVRLDLVEPGEEELRAALAIIGKGDALLDELVAGFHRDLHLVHLGAAQEHRDGGAVAEAALRLVHLQQAGSLRVGNLRRRVGDLGPIEAGLAEELIHGLPRRLNLPLELGQVVPREHEGDGPDGEVGGHLALGKPLHGHVFLHALHGAHGVPDQQGAHGHAGDEAKAEDPAEAGVHGRRNGRHPTGEPKKNEPSPAAPSHTNARSNLRDRLIDEL